MSYLVTAWAENGQAFQILVEPSFNRNNAIALAKKMADEQGIPFELKYYDTSSVSKNTWYSAELFEPIEPDEPLEVKEGDEYFIIE